MKQKTILNRIRPPKIGIKSNRKISKDSHSNWPLYKRMSTYTGSQGRQMTLKTLGLLCSASRTQHSRSTSMATSVQPSWPHHSLPLGNLVTSLGQEIMGWFSPTRKSASSLAVVWKWAIPTHRLCCQDATTTTAWIATKAVRAFTCLWCFWACIWVFGIPAHWQRRAVQLAARWSFEFKKQCSIPRLELRVALMGA